MYNKFYPKFHVWPVGRTNNIFLIMKLTVFLLVSFILEANAGAYAHKITLRTSKKYKSISDTSKSVTIAGRIFEAKDPPLPLFGATIAVVGSSQATVTDAHGFFKLNNVPINSTLRVTMIGYKPQEYFVRSAKVDLTISLFQALSELDEVVVTGFQKQKKREIASSVTTINMDNYINKPITQLSQALEGGGTGIMVNQSSGLVGGDQATITIRGTATINSTAPLVLVDGVPYDMNNLDPNTVASISVLKDAAAASMYGARGANGVIVITTKRGVAGAIDVNYNGYFGLQQPTYKPDFVDAPTYMKMINERNINGGGAAPYSQGAIDSTASGKYPITYPNTNWESLILRNLAPIQTHSLLLSGGNTASRFVIDINNTDQLGQLQEYNNTPTSKYSRTTVRVNSTVDLAKNVLIYTDLFAARTDQTEPYTPYGGTTANLYSKLYTAPPNIVGAYPAKPFNELPAYIQSLPGYVFYGNFGQSQEPLELLQLAGTQKTSDNLAIINMRPEWKITPDLTFNGQASYNVESGVLAQQQNSHNFYNYFTYLAEGQTTPLTVSSSLQGGNTYFYWGGNLDYNKTVGKNSITGLLGYTQELSSSQLTDIALRSIFAKATYAYDERYLVELGIRRDGSSIFGPGYQWGNFPSIALGWNINREAFFNVPEITELKIRASYGSLGNNNVSPYQYQTTINGNGTESNIGNPEIEWEKTNMVNFGTDLSLKSGFDATIEWFNKRTNDELYRTPALLTGGIGSGAYDGNTGPLENAFSARVDGLEADLKYHHKLFKDFNFNVGIGFTRETSRVMQLLASNGNAPIINGNTILYVGGPLYANYGYRTDGLLQQADMANSSVAKMPGEQAGDIKYVDANHDGTINSKDMEPLGNNQPTNIYYGSLGFSYKGFDFQGLVTGQGGNGIYYTGQLANPFNGGSEATPQQAQTDTWTPQNTNAKLPRLADGANLAFSDFYEHSGYWERVRYLQLGYSFSQTICNKIRLKSLRIYINAQNPFTIDSVPLLDPEEASAGAGISAVPIMKVYSFGLNVKF